MRRRQHAPLPLLEGHPVPKVGVDHTPRRTHLLKDGIDGLLARALATQHADAFAVVPKAFAVAAPYVVNGTAPCGCRPGVENQPPTKTMRRSVRDYDAYLVRAVGARGDADDEARARGL